MQRIGVLTSGGDASGMNSCIRAVVRKAIYHGLEIIGINRGYSGFVDADMGPMNLGSVADIIGRGGTILHTARSKRFQTKEGRALAFENVQRFGVQGLVVIGGDGSFTGASIFQQEYGIPVIGVPGTIDNDIAGTDYTIGFDTAVNNVVEAINKIRDTATSHERTFVIEVMGRNSGNIALAAGLAGGAESILIPEIPFNVEDICKKLLSGIKRGKLHSVILVAEGAASGIEIGQEIKEFTGFDTKVTILGHLQRGGSPSAFDRILAARLGAKAVELLMAGETNKMVGMKAGEIVASDLSEVIGKASPINKEMYELAKILSI
ncbi:6-phosphofructokinase [Desulforamulus aeronauticus]|uniref:ATP-dependent 6-phosphofructokinase n=1 Tax=Desulforamulus aeronauticus DSM 10349 TaxID=1121421 RepID=A0A1M6R682_9FIRM|nr:6-phosphofructokinase [Desulforamulus aeronauticus]SHK27999.1 6-phosphofructokinase [Desulforamulus aeronauticus DSM 10349]